MKTKLITLAVCLAVTTTAMAINPWKALALALGSFSLAQGGLQTDQCDAEPCEYLEEYDQFDDHYLKNLTTCEKEKLLPVMDTRATYMEKTAEALQKPRVTADVTKQVALQRMQEIAHAYKNEIRALKDEILKTQELLFDDCVSDESKEILAKHASMLINALNLHSANLEKVETYLKQIN